MMFTDMSWNVENLVKLDPTDRRLRGQARRARQRHHIDAPNLLGMQEVGEGGAFGQLWDRLGLVWTGVLSTHFDSPHTIRVGWLVKATIRTRLDRDGGLR